MGVSTWWLPREPLNHDGSAAGDFVLQRCGQMIDVGCRDVDRRAFEQRNAAAADGIAPDLDQQCLDNVGIELLWRQANEIAERAPYRQRSTVGAGAGHGVEGIGDADDANRHWYFFLREFVGIAGSITALVMPAHGLRNTGPRERNASDDLVADRRVIGHLAKFIGIERARFAEEAPIDGDLSDIVQISCTTEGGDVIGVHAHGIADGGGVSPDAQGVPVNIHMLDVNGGGEGFERIVIEAVQRSHEAQILGNTLRNRLSEHVILNGESDVAAEQFEGVEFIVFVKRFAGTAAQTDDAGEAASGFQRSQALEQFWRDVAVRTQEYRVGRGIENDGSAGRGESVHVFGEERNEGGIWHESESQRGGGTQDGRLLAEQKQRPFAGARCLHYGRQHESRGFRELALGRQGRPEFGKRLDRVQQPS
jgi:hypothetical protein